MGDWTFDTLGKLGIALGLGLLVGLQREWQQVSGEVAGIRTFSLISLLGAVSALLAEQFSGWLAAAGLIAVAAMLLTGNLAEFLRGEFGPGKTTEIAALLMYGVGAAVVAGYTIEAIAVSGAVATLLHWKQPLHRFVDRIGQNEFRAIIQFVLIALVILPVLPNRTFDVFNVLNPFKIWLMVVLIVGISLAAYVAYRILGTRAGALLGGALGGLISSTATTVSYARFTKGRREHAPMAAMVILIASTIVNGRVLFEIGVVAPRLLRYSAPPLIALTLFMILLCLVLLWKSGSTPAGEEMRHDPSQLKAALVFGGLYAGVLFAVAATENYLGVRGIYVLAAISGLTDVDAITLSTAELYQTDRLEADTAWRVVLLALMSNLIFKGFAVVVLGHRRLWGYIGVVFGLSFVVGIAILLFWPEDAWAKWVSPHLN